MHIQSEAGKSDAASSSVELMAGQCAVVQCNYEHGRQFIRSVLGEPSGLGIQALYRGERLRLNRSEIVQRVGCCFWDDGLYERMKVADYLTFWGRLYTTRMPASELLTLVGLEGHKEIIPSPNQKFIAVVTCSNKSEFVQIMNVEEGRISPELVESARVKYGTQKGLDTWIRTDHENYSYANHFVWKDNDTLEFEGSLAYQDTEIIENVNVAYQFSKKLIEIKGLHSVSE
ncbi:hypothetical protein A3844_10810 [Paenibacillus helianthi]|uniref:Uncharacterized protein n=1 Tax=Paenibacillus helianthi TaxID=1349432 RepID=A0ABX3ES63_9BACL|nr:hypothetical protein A3844_10810 [Paenibacillus helianthi]